jgi:hypothetical protein
MARRVVGEEGEALAREVADWIEQNPSTPGVPPGTTSLHVSSCLVLTEHFW